MIRTNLFYRALFSVLSVSVSIAGCSGGTDENLPVALKDSIPITIPTSTFNLPVSYAISDLEEFINQKIQGEFLDAIINPLKNEKDEVKVEMYKFSNIQLSSRKGELIILFPLKIRATILKSRLNLITKGIQPMETELELELRTPASLDSNWHLVTRFDLLQIRWVEKPILNLKGIHIDLTKKMEEYINGHEEKLTSLLDKDINKGVSLEKAVGKVWRDLQRPIVIHKKPPLAYIKFICRSIAGNFSVGANEITCRTTIKANLMMMTDTTVKSTVLKLPKFKEKSIVDAHSDIHLYAFADITGLNQELNLLLKGKSFSVKGMSAKLESLETYAADSGLVVKAVTSGTINTSLVAIARPYFNPETQSFSISNFQFRLASSNLLITAGDALLHNMIRDTVQSHLTMRMDSLINRVPAIIEHAIAKGKTGRTIDLDVNDLRVLSCEIKMGSKRIHFNVHARLVAGINLKKLKPGKQIHINPKKKDEKPVNP